MQSKAFLGVLLCLVVSVLCHPIEVNDCQTKDDPIAKDDTSDGMKDNSTVVANKDDSAEAMSEDDDGSKNVTEIINSYKDNVKAAMEKNEVFKKLEKTRLKLKNQLEKVSEDLDQAFNDNRNSTHTTVSVIKPIQSIVGLFGGLFGGLVETVVAGINETINVAETLTHTEEFDNVTRSVSTLVEESSGLLEKVIDIKIRTGEQILASFKGSLRITDSDADDEEEETGDVKDDTENQDVKNIDSEKNMESMDEEDEITDDGPINNIVLEGLTEEIDAIADAIAETAEDVSANEILLENVPLIDGVDVRQAIVAAR